VSVGQLFAGSMIPGLMLVGLYILYQLVFAFLRPDDGPGDPAGGTRPHLRRELARALVPPIVLIVAVLGSILGGVATPTEAAAVGAIGATLLAGLRQRAILADLSGRRSRRRRWSLLGGAFDLRLGRARRRRCRPIAIGAAALAVGLAFGVAVALWRCFRGAACCRRVHATMTITAMIFATLIGATLFALVFRGLGGEETVELLSRPSRAVSSARCWR
jgi:TRAP-type mannitol/chloroaromatic compound transport system permease large subunit